MLTVRRTCCFISVALSLWAGGVKATPPEDTLAKLPRQIRVGLDIARPLVNLLAENRYQYEAEVDVSLRKDNFAVLEAGFGGFKSVYADLSYSSTNTFVRLGFDKSFLKRLFPQDWDGGIFGIRLAAAPTSQTAVTYVSSNPIWGTVNGSQEATNRVFYWTELTGGIRLELLPRFFTGWNVRVKYLFNTLEEDRPTPGYIAGYGAGDKSTAFDFNVWVMWAFRRDRK